MSDVLNPWIPALAGGAVTGVITLIGALLGQAVAAGKMKTRIDDREKSDIDYRVEQARLTKERHDENTKKFDRLEVALSAGEQGTFVTRREHDLTVEGWQAASKRIDARLEGIENDMELLIRRGARNRRTRRT